MFVVEKGYKEGMERIVSVFCPHILIRNQVEIVHLHYYLKTIFTVSRLSTVDSRTCIVGALYKYYKLN